MDSLSKTIAPLSHDTTPCESRVLVVRHDVGSVHRAYLEHSPASWLGRSLWYQEIVTLVSKVPLVSPAAAGRPQHCGLGRLDGYFLLPDQKSQSSGGESLGSLPLDPVSRCPQRRRSGSAPVRGVSAGARGQMLYMAEAEYPFLSVTATMFGPEGAVAGTVNVQALMLPSELASQDVETSLPSKVTVTEPCE
jgi:hypothetical protein